MMSHRVGNRKGFTSDPCLYWRWKQWKVFSYRQSNLAVSVHEGRERCNRFSADTFNRGRNNRHYIGHSWQLHLWSLLPQRHLHHYHLQTPNCDGISSASICQKMTSSLLPLELWDNMSWESTSSPEFRDRPALLFRSLSWILSKMAMTRSPMAKWNQSWQMPFQRPSLRWLAVVAKQTVLLQVLMQNPNLIQHRSLSVRQWVSEW